MVSQLIQTLRVVTEASGAWAPWPAMKAARLLKVSVVKGEPAIKLMLSDVSVKSSARREVARARKPPPWGLVRRRAKLVTICVAWACVRQAEALVAGTVGAWAVVVVAVKPKQQQALL
jgi:hypothetical protein